MPRKINQKARNISLQESKRINTRLLKISMRLDEHVYNNRQIPSDEAVMYLDEIGKYKTKCQDARPLQVIEKLTRCMKGIIAEQESNNTIIENTTIHNGRNTFVSPAYSLANENKVIFSEKTELITQAEVNFNKGMSTVYTEDVETIDLCEENENNDSTENYKDFRNITEADKEIINIIEEKDDNKAATDYFKVDVKMHKAISNLCVQDYEGISDTVDCSQRILVDFQDNVKEVSFKKNHGVRLRRQFKPPVKPKSASTSCITDSKPLILEKVANNQTVKPIADIINKQNDNKVEHFGDNNALNPNDDESITKLRTPIVKRNTTQNKRKANLVKKQNKRNKKIKNIKRKKNTPFKNIQEEIKDPALNILASNINQQKNNTVNNQIQTKITDSVINTLTHTLEESKAAIQTSIDNTTLEKIYNESVENDLSWVENLRYVREIASDEFDAKLGNLEDCFWNNLSLPNDWNDQDFDI